MKEICKTEGCERPVRSRGLCSPCHSRAWRAVNPEWHAVYRHHMDIVCKPRSTYRNLPFNPAWNPAAGGSFQAGAQWIIANIGRRPDRHYHLHIIERSFGFMPNNLIWVPKEKHRQDEMLNRVLRENQQLKMENERLRTSR